MSTAILVVPAAPEHVSSIFAMVRELAEYEKLAHLHTGTEADLRRDLFGPQPDDAQRPSDWSPSIEGLVALEGAQAVGYALYFHNYSTFLARKGLYLEDIYVRPALRGRGVGKALLARVARLAHERGCGRFEWSVLDWNAPSIAFYESLGARVLPDWRIVRMEGEALARLAGVG
jgi:GNAT superfamily N-acetyltransferase